ncbi:MAG TPA: hypothetical protein PKW95_00685 [bacterium]|nr:hypothetical protein [bacterium]
MIYLDSLFFNFHVVFVVFPLFSQGRYKDLVGKKEKEDVFKKSPPDLLVSRQAETAIQL